MSDLPTDFSPEYKIAGLDFTVENGKIVFKNAKKGKYTLTVSDKNNNYADMTTTFILSVDSAPASYNNDNENPAITKMQMQATKNLQIISKTLPLYLSMENRMRQADVEL